MRTAAAMSAIGLLLAGPAAAAPAPLTDAPPPPMLQNVDIDEHLGAQLPLDLSFKDQAGQSVRLADYANLGRPILLVLAYYRCPMLCSMVLAGAEQAVRKAGWRPGIDFNAITVSFDPTEGPREAAEKRRGFTHAIGLPYADPAWPFLTGPIESIRALTAAVGFRYKYDPDTNQFAHAAAIFVLTPSGTISRYLYGVTFEPRDLRLALVEAAAGRAGPTLDRVLLRCFRYNPASRRYELFIASWFRIGGLLVLAAVGIPLLRFWRREWRRRPVSPVIR